MNLRRFETDDWPEVEAIYGAGIETGNTTFELEPHRADQSTTSLLATDRCHNLSLRI